jgi:hypothetical protein
MFSGFSHRGFRSNTSCCSFPMDDSIYEYYSGRVVVVGLPTGFLSLAFPNEFPIQLLGSFRVPKACSIFVSPFSFSFFLFQCGKQLRLCNRQNGRRGAHLGFSVWTSREFHFRKQQRNNHLLDINTENKTKQNSLNLITDELWIELIMSQFDNVVICFWALFFSSILRHRS